jgi:hypothetical protein
VDVKAELLEAPRVALLSLVKLLEHGSLGAQSIPVSALAKLAKHGEWHPPTTLTSLIWA